MQKVKNELLPAMRLTTGEERQHFFGYYDVAAWDDEERRHLCHRVAFWDRLPEPFDTAEIGYIERTDNTFVPLAETNAWNFQQGAMLQWNPAKPGSEILFNSRLGGTFAGGVLNVHTGAALMLDQPIACVDRSGTYALSINFSRLYDFRPGYGYAGVPDPYRDAHTPRDDGIYRIDLRNGHSSLVLSLEEIGEFTKPFFGHRDVKLLVNHITFNTDGTRFVALVRSFPERGRTWRTAMITANSDGSQLHLLSKSDYASHYHWRDERQLAVHAGDDRHDQGVKQMYVFHDRTEATEVIDPDFFAADGHCSYSPDRKWMLYDSYPDDENYQHLYLYNLVKKEGLLLGSYYSDPRISGDIRCDLHPRWSPSGRRISFDSTHEGQRHVYVIDLEQVVD